MGELIGRHGHESTNVRRGHDSYVPISPAPRFYTAAPVQRDWHVDVEQNNVEYGHHYPVHNTAYTERPARGYPDTESYDDEQGNIQQPDSARSSAVQHGRLEKERAKTAEEVGNLQEDPEEESTLRRSTIRLGKFTACWLITGSLYCGVTTAQSRFGFGNESHTLTSDKLHDASAVITGPVYAPIDFTNRIVKPMVGFGKATGNGVGGIWSYTFGKL